ncbi:MAG TPA: hypothetical protein PLC79_05335 [Phycisphaerae bacterium]|nr:hypothetical protein [Phycisphaerae bacterium]
MREAYRYARGLARICGAAVLLVPAGCQAVAGPGDPAASVDAVVQALQQFLGDFARQALAAFLF